MNRDQIAEAMDAERSQIAHEIHDALLPLIFAASAALQRQLDEYDKNLQPSTADRQRLRQAFQWLQQAKQVGRQILTRTHPPELSEDSWDNAARTTITQLTEEEDKESSPHVDWQIDIASRTLSRSAAAACYRIVVEAIRNAIRHGKATEVTVSATRENNQVVVSVIDNGSGFEIHQVPEDRFGIRSMRGRAQLAGGNLQLESRPGGPTKIQLSLPAQN